MNLFTMVNIPRGLHYRLLETIASIAHESKRPQKIARGARNNRGGGARSWGRSQPESAQRQLQTRMIRCSTDSGYTS